MQTNYDSKSITHWTKRQDLHYHFYVILKYPWIIQEDSRQSTIFKDMHRFIPTRTPAQSRSHHQKRIKGHPHLSNALHLFFRQHYSERLLDADHLRKELRHFILQAHQGGRITGEERYELLDAIEANLAVLNFVTQNISGKDVERERHKEGDDKQEKQEANNIEDKFKQIAIRHQEDMPHKEERDISKPESKRLCFKTQTIKISQQSRFMERAVYDEDEDCFCLP